VTILQKVTKSDQKYLKPMFRELLSNPSLQEGPFLEMQHVLPLGNSLTLEVQTVLRRRMLK
jgi:hypothetical protein